MSFKIDGCVRACVYPCNVDLKVRKANGIEVEVLIAFAVIDAGFP